MNDFTLWVTAIGASAAATAAAAVSYGAYSYLRSRLPMAVRYRDLENRILELESQCADFKEQVERQRQELKDIELRRYQALLETEEARNWLAENQRKIEQIPAMKEQIAKVEQEAWEKQEILKKVRDCQ